MTGDLVAAITGGLLGAITGVLISTQLPPNDIAGGILCGAGGVWGGLLLGVATWRAARKLGGAS